MKRLILWLPVIVFFVSCVKEASNEFVAYPVNPQNDTTWASIIADSAAVNQLITLLSPSYLVDSFDISTGGIMHYNDNTEEVYFPSNCLSGTVTGKIKVEYLHLKSKGDMVRFAKPTTSNDRILISGGAFFIRASKDGTSFQPSASSRIKISYTNPAPDNAMKLFYGDTAINNTDGFNWVPAEDSATVTTWKQEDSSGIKLGYELLSPKFGWINCDKFSDTSMPRTTLTDTLPLNFTNKNTAVFAVFKDQWSVLRLYADAANKLFYATNIPEESKIILVSISKIGNDLYLGSKEIIVTAGKVEGLSPQVSSKDAMIGFLDSL